MITNMALNSTPDELELYFIQAAKDDNWKFELLKHCRGCIVASSAKDEYDKFSKIIAMLEYINNEIDTRGNIIKRILGRRSEDININVFNELLTTKSKEEIDNLAKKYNLYELECLIKKEIPKMPVLFLLIDEAATMNKETSDKTLNRMVKRVRELCERISATGRFVGVYETNTLQRASKDELSREVKINSTNWISFSQMDAASSNLAIGDDKSALGLPQRVFVCKMGSEIRYGKTPFSAWDKAINLLENQNKIKVEDENQFKIDYSHWLLEEEENENIDKKEQVTIDLTNELKDSQKLLVNANERIANLEFENRAKDEALKGLRLKIKCLENSKDKNEIIKEEKENLEEFKEDKYIGCQEQKDKAIDLSTDVYVCPPIVDFKKSSTKFKVTDDI